VLHVPTLKWERRARTPEADHVARRNSLRQTLWKWAAEEPQDRGQILILSAGMLEGFFYEPHEPSVEFRSGLIFSRFRDTQGIPCVVCEQVRLHVAQARLARALAVWRQLCNLSLAIWAFQGRFAIRVDLDNPVQ
jgi:hypothetical protein